MGTVNTNTIATAFGIVDIVDLTLNLGSEICC